jgi:tRNA-2-methylthio-N6-dimethylallyladenosine synthase
MTNKLLYISTIGCQMNVYDSEQIVSRLAGAGYGQTATLEKADLILLNTCTVRAKAEQKAFSFLGRLAKLKKKRPGLIIGVGGCVAQQEGDRILGRVPHIDLVFGTRAIDRLPALVAKIETKRCRIVDVSMSEETDMPDSAPVNADGNPISKFVTIMRGCDNYCTYCVVPYVRGRESSRDPDHIVAEIESMVANGAREVTLLGQNVNSYGKKEGLPSFAELLELIRDIDGLYRIRFTTSHPKDFGSDLIQAYETNDKLCRHIHLPVQSGSNRMLKRMNRKYTRELYLDKVNKLRDTCPDIAITSDMIVGFPGESEHDFNQTLELMREVEFDGLFAFMYSDRPNAPATRFEGKISDNIKSERLRILLELQETFTKAKNEALIGTVQTIITEGFSKRQSSSSPDEQNQAAQWTGRTTTNKIVNFYHDDSSEDRGTVIPGNWVQVKIEKAHAHSLWGIPVDTKPTADGLKGESSYAA